jgi:hypothetical protein
MRRCVLRAFDLFDAWQARFQSLGQRMFTSELLMALLLRRVSRLTHRCTRPILPVKKWWR